MILDINFLDINIFIGAFIAGIISTIFINLIRQGTPIKEDTAMGIVFSAFVPLGITLITIIQKDNKIDPKSSIWFIYPSILNLVPVTVYSPIALQL